MNKGILCGIGAYALWGFLPIYWKLLQKTPALQLLCHRIGWSFLLLLGVILATRKWKEFRSTLKVRAMRIYALAALLLAVNWVTYVLALSTPTRPAHSFIQEQRLICLSLAPDW